MIDGLEPYPAYKDSGVPWLGEVPEHWEVRRLKQAFRRIVGGSTPSSAVANFWDGDVVWVTPADVSRAERLGNSLRRITRDGLKSCSSELLPAGSIVVTSRAPVGNVSLAETELCTNQGCKALVATDEVVNPVFGFHVLKTLKGELQSLATGTTFSEISTSRIGNVAMPLPPLPEQAAIVRFLDHADRRIRRYVRAKQKLIKLLEEQKQAIIHRAVTRGLDPNVRLKPSGVAWLGDVPEHWEATRLKAVLSRPLRNGLFKKKDAFGSGVPLINVADVYRDNFQIDPKSLERVQASPDEVRTYQVQSGDLFFVRSSLKLEGTGRSAVAIGCESDSVFECHLVQGRPDRRRVEGRFLAFQLNSFALRHYMVSRANAVTMATVAQDVLGSCPVLLPSVYDQGRLLQQIDRQCERVKAAVDRARSEISLLREYRTRLIADVVTGKLDVREAAARLPDEAEEPEPLDEVDDAADVDDDTADDLDAVPEEAEA